MKNLVCGLVFALVSSGAVSGEVGAPNPRVSTAALSYDVAVVDEGATDSWVARTDEFRAVPTEAVNIPQVALLSKQLETINAKISQELTRLIDEKVAVDTNF